MKIQKKNFFFFGGGGSGGGDGGGSGRVGLGGQSGCERRIEVFVKNQKKHSFLGGWVGRWGGGRWGGVGSGGGKVGGGGLVGRGSGWM